MGETYLALARVVFGYAPPHHCLSFLVKAIPTYLHALTCESHIQALFLPPP